MTTPSWKERLAHRIEPDLEQQIDDFETQIELKRQGKLDDKIFAESRLRRGVYGQRYDNGQRHDGIASRSLRYPSGDLTKGPETLWDAPGMLRIKIPFGALSAEQMDVLAELAEEYSDGICHVTTRQDIQLHFIQLDDTPDIMRRLGAVGITTQEACGNSVRNVTGCPLAGVCGDEAFDVSPYARALTHFLLGHKDCQDFGRKFKISFSGCADHACALASMHDLGVIATTREIAGETVRGFQVYVGGGLGAVPHQAKLLSEYCREEELLPTAQAVCRVFARLGEKRNRARARIKFVVAKLGIEAFREEVATELTRIPHDDRWTTYLDDLTLGTDSPTRDPGEIATKDDATKRWLATNVSPQRQDGYHVVTIHLPLGDLTSDQMRALADITRDFNGGHARATVEQNIVLRWISCSDLTSVHEQLVAASLATTEAGTAVDITACPGTDTCKLGISSSRGLASELRKRLLERALSREESDLDASVHGLRIKISGCFNSCGQHHVADIGFYGVSRKQGNRTVPHFQVVLGGQTKQNAGSYGLAVVAIPSKRIPDALERITDGYLEDRLDEESFQDYVTRVGKAPLRQSLQDLTLLPTYEDEPATFSDWRDPREYTIGDMGVGECAGEVVPLVQFGLAASEQKVFEAQLQLDGGLSDAAAAKAYEAMLQAAKALARVENIDTGDEPDAVVSEFKARFYDTERFFDRFAGAKFANYLLAAHEAGGTATTADAARQRLEEAQLFIEAAHSCYARISEEEVATVQIGSQQLSKLGASS